MAEQGLDGHGLAGQNWISKMKKLGEQLEIERGWGSRMRRIRSRVRR